MSFRFQMVISHAPADHTIAACLKRFLETVFLNADVFLSGLDLDGERYARALQGQLRGNSVLLTLLTRRAVLSPRIYFEAGAAFMEGRALLVCTDGLRLQELKPPLSMLPAINLDVSGVRRLLVLIADRTGVVAPREYPGLEDTLQTIQGFITLRQREGNGPSVGVPVGSNGEAAGGAGPAGGTAGPPNGGAPPIAANGSSPNGENGDPQTRDPIDAAIQVLYRRLKDQLKVITVKSIVRAAQHFELPAKDDLKGMSLPELVEIATRGNIPIPELECIMMASLEMQMPTEKSPRWTKMNAFRVLEGIEEGLRRFERRM